MPQRTTLVAIILSALVGFAGPSAHATDRKEGKSEKKETITEELLRTLHEEGQLSDEAYQKLEKRHRKERKRKGDRSSAGGPKDWEFRWDNGLRFSRNDGRHKFKIATQFQNDWALIDPDGGEGDSNSNGLESGTEFRRARVALSGKLYDRFGFNVKVDFSDGKAEFKGVWVSVEDLGPLGTLTIGQFKEPFSLEFQTSSKYITFMERGLPIALSPRRGTGFQFSNAPLDKRMTWTVAAVRQTDEVGAGFSGDDSYDVGARVTGLPFYNEDGSHYVHVGVSYVHQFRTGNETFRYRARPESHLADRLLDTYDEPKREINENRRDFQERENAVEPQRESRGQDLFGFELAYVAGPVSFQGEFTGSKLNNKREEGGAFLWGAYGMATVSLTGEHRVYKKKTGSFGRMEPRHNFNPKKGHWGAWEIAVRASYLDLDDNNVEGGTLRDITGGVNWYLNPNFRWMVNYVRSDLKGAGITHIGQMRFQVDF
jgi:phosphate-selective porin OprO and OprP